MTARAAAILDWGTARRIGSRLAGQGPRAGKAERARLREDFAGGVREAESLIVDLTELRAEGPSTRPWVMTREEWITRNLRSFEGVLRPVGERLLKDRGDGPLAAVRRKTLGTQVGLLLGYVGRKVLGQYDLFLPPDDRDLLYFVGPNVLTLERRFALAPRDFRLWIALHEVTHRVQFDGVPWLRPYVLGLVDEYLGSIDLDARRLAETLRRAVEEARRSDRWRGMGFLSLFMTPEQRETFRKMQSVMSLLEGHGNYVMHTLARGRISSAERMQRLLRRRRQGRGMQRLVHRAVGLDVKVSQYDVGERFVASVVERAGMEGFNLVWRHEGNLPSLEEIHQPDAWVARVGAGS